MELTNVTVTGADDTVSPLDLFPIAKRFPFAEFGILLSGSSSGNHRFPSLGWIEELNEYANIYSVPQNVIQLSGHLCGSWVKQICRGEEIEFPKEFQNFENFSRIQLNFHGLRHLVNEAKFFDAIKKYFPTQQVIFQIDGENDDIFENALNAGLNVAALFDKSGGAGRLPGEWPKPFTKEVGHAIHGYAGGLSVENLEEQLKLIETASEGVPFWVDAETHLYSIKDHDTLPGYGKYVFDLDKVYRFLEIGEKCRG